MIIFEKPLKRIAMFIVLQKELKLLRTAHASLAKKADNLRLTIERRVEHYNQCTPNWKESERGAYHSAETSKMQYAHMDIQIELTSLTQTINELEKL